MLKSLQNILIIIALIGIIIILIIYTQNKIDKNEIIDNITEPFMTNIINKKVLFGNLYPEEEISINSPISGVLEEYYVSIGDIVQKGDNIAKIKLIPDPLQLESTKNNLQTSQITYKNDSVNFERNKDLFKKEVISKIDYETSLVTFELSKARYELSKNQLRLLEEGYIPSSDISNVVKAVTEGTIIDLPLAIGEPVVERNNFREGSSIAVIAKLDRYLFKAKIVENDVIVLHDGMEIKISPASRNEFTTKGTITKISSRGVIENGLMKYSIEAIIDVPDSLTIYSGFNATAEIEVERKDSVWAVNEKDLIFDHDSIFIKILDKKNQEVVRKSIKLGISDGINVEIIYQ